MDLRSTYIESLESCIKATKQQPAFFNAGAIVVPLTFVETLIEHFKKGLSKDDELAIGRLIQGQLDRVRTSWQPLDDLTDEARGWIDILSKLNLVGTVFIENKLLQDKIIERT